MWTHVTPAQAIQLIAPGITALFALGFLCMRFYEPSLRYLTILSVSFWACASASSAQILHWPADWQANALVSAALYAVGILALAQGVLQRREPTLGYQPGASVAACMATGVYYFSSVHPELAARIYILHIGAGSTLLGVVARLWRHPGNREIDRVLLIALLVFGVSFLVNTVLTIPPAFPQNPEQFGQTSFWIVLQVTLVLLGATLGLILLAVAMSDIIGDLKKTNGLDPLTGTLNRLALEQRAQDELANPRHHPVALLMFDIDHFKSVNDRYGHLAGDSVLKEFGRLLTESVRVTDIVGRYGGEEFVVVLHNTDADRGYRIAERIRANLETARFNDVSPSLTVTVSGGVAQLIEQDSFINLFARADSLLYRAKRDGRNRILAIASREIAGADSV